MKSQAETPKLYIEEQSLERQKDLKKIRALIRKSLPKGYKESMQYGMINYFVPEENGLTRVNVSLASQKGYMALYLSNIYNSPKGEKKFKELYCDGGFKLNMGKSCLRFKSLDDLNVEFVSRLLSNQLPTPFK